MIMSMVLSMALLVVNAVNVSAGEYEGLQGAEICKGGF